MSEAVVRLSDQELENLTQLVRSERATRLTVATPEAITPLWERLERALTELRERRQELPLVVLAASGESFELLSGNLRRLSMSQRRRLYLEFIDWVRPLLEADVH